MRIYIKSLVAITSLLTTTVSFSDNLDTKDYRAATFYIGGGAGLSLRKSVSQNNDVLLFGYYRHSTQNDNFEDKSVDAETSGIENPAVHNDYTSSFVEMASGIRHYFNRDKYSIFVEPRLGVSFNYRKNNFYRDIDTDKKANLRTYETLALIGETYFGVEYFVTSAISLQGMYGVWASGSVFNFNKSNRRTDINSSVLSSVSVNYFW